MSSFIETTQNGHILEIRVRSANNWPFIERRDAVFQGR